MLQQPLAVVAAVIVAILLAAPVAGHRLGTGARHRADRREDASERAGETSGAALLALLGLLLAFTFSLSVQHAEGRRNAVIDEAAAIGTAFLRADLLAEPGRTELQTALRDYAETRRLDRNFLYDRAAFDAFMEHTLAAQARLWPTMLAATGGDTPPPIRALVANGITDVLDAHTRRYAEGIRLMPDIARVLILTVAAAALVITGNTSGLQGRALTWRTFVFAGTLAFLIVLIIDIERGREGFVQADFSAIDMLIADLNRAIGPG